MRTRKTYKIERQLVNHPDTSRLRKRFRDNEDFGEMLSPLDCFESEKTPVALITFVLSIFVSTDMELRQWFYDSYNGKIPAFTQFCLNTFRLGPISNTETVTGFRFIDDEYQATLFCCALGSSIFDKDDPKLDFEYILAWFRVLGQHFTSREKPYLEYVDFERVPWVSIDKNYLCGLRVTNEGVTCGETGYFYELTREQKDTYIMLARVVDRVCVPKNTDLPVPHKNLLERDFNEREITSKLVRFIVSGCKTFLA